MHASVETIYQAIYLQARGELKQELKRAMRQGRTARRPQGGQGRKPRFREPMAMISERPPEIEDRAVPGHWEGDLITGSRNKSAIGTLVERTTRFTILLHLPDGHDAEHVQQAIIDKMQHLPKLLRNSLTWDQGAELALHCVCSIESGPCERVDVFHVSGRFWSTSACGEKRTPARPAWTSFPS